MPKNEDFEERKKIIDFQREADLERHNFKMEELRFMRESDAIRHDQDMERQRIKSAEIRKMQMRKQEGGYKY